MDTNKLAGELRETTDELLREFAAFTNDEINTVPFEGSWTAGELGQHLVISASGFLQLINGPVSDTERDPEQNVDKIRKTFLDFTTKMQSPDFVVPPKKSYNKEEQLSSAGSAYAGVAQAITTLDASKTCTAFALPALGQLTRYEAASFVLYHTQRHLHQLKNIHAALDRAKEEKS